MSSPGGRKGISALVRFKWGMEEAHDGDFTVLELTHEPRGLLTASTDRCVKMWSLGGRCTGSLLQSINMGVQNPRWELMMDVADREAKESEDILSIMDSVKQAKVEEERGIEELARQQTGAIKVSSGGRRKKATKPRSCISGRCDVSTPAETSKRQHAHDRVLGVLSNVRSMHVHAESDTHDSRSYTTGITDGEMSFGSSSIIVGDSKLREKNRRLPPCQCPFIPRQAALLMSVLTLVRLPLTCCIPDLQFDDPISHAPIELTGLGTGFEHLGPSPSSQSGRCVGV
jgi:hypothetical protein